MIVDILKQQFSSLLDEMGVIGWAVIGCYVAIFTVGIIIKTLDSKAKRQKANMSARKDEISIKIQEINLRLAEIKLAREEAIEKARTSRYVPEVEVEIEAYEAEESELESELQAANDEYYSAANDDEYGAANDDYYQPQR